MTITVRRVDGETFQIVGGAYQLNSELQLRGKATVTDIETQETFMVHVVEGRVVPLDQGHSAIAETIAAAAIERARRR